MDRLSRPLYKLLAAGLIMLLVVPSASLIMPRPAHAIDAEITSDTSPASIFRNIKEAASALFNGQTAASSASLQLKEYVLDPLVRVVAQVALKALTASVVNWINGQGSGGSPQFVQNLGLYLLVTADNEALHFFAEITGQSNSPFALVIASSLRTNYLQSTSAAGFWAANQCTLFGASPNINSFLAGNFNQGGWAAWFSLTTLPQNNPYTLFFRSEAELNARIAGIQAQQQAKLNWGQGFFSWCGSGGSDSSSSSGSGTSGSTAKTDQKIELQTITPEKCLSSDGSIGSIQTPGSVIAASVNKALGAGQDSLVSAHEIDEAVDVIFSALVTKVLGTGLALISGSGNLTDQLRSGNGLGTGNGLGGTTGGDLENSLHTSLQGYTEQVGQYQTAWVTITAAANTASTTVLQVLACEKSNGTGDTYGAQAALDGEVAPVLAQGASAALQVASSSAAIKAAGLEIANAMSATDLSKAAGDVQALLLMPPSASDASDAEQQASVTGGATSTGDTSLTVSGGTLVDQMNLLNKHANNAFEACEAPPIL